MKVVIIILWNMFSRLPNTFATFFHVFISFCLVSFDGFCTFKEKTTLKASGLMLPDRVDARIVELMMIWNCYLIGWRMLIENKYKTWIIRYFSAFKIQNKYVGKLNYHELFTAQAKSLKISTKNEQKVAFVMFFNRSLHTLHFHKIANQTDSEIFQGYKNFFIESTLPFIFPNMVCVFNSPAFRFTHKVS